MKELRVKKREKKMRQTKMYRKKKKRKKKKKKKKKTMMEVSKRGKIRNTVIVERMKEKVKHGM